MKKHTGGKSSSGSDKKNRRAESSPLFHNLSQDFNSELNRANPDTVALQQMLIGFPPEFTRKVLEAAAVATPVQAFPFLQSLTVAADPALVFAAVQALSLIHTPTALNFLLQLEQETAPTDSVLRKEISRSLHRLRSAGVKADADVTVAAAGISGERRFHRAYLSNPDGAGHMNIVLVLLSPGGKYETASLLLSWQKGIMEMRLHSFNERQLAQYLAEWDLDRFGFRLVEIERDYFNYLVHHYARVNREQALPLPVEFSYWSKHMPEPAANYAQHPVYSRLDPNMIEQAGSLLRRQTNSLHATPETKGWILPLQEIADLCRKWQDRTQSKIILSPAYLQEFQMRLAGEALERVFTADYRRDYIDQLEMLAYVYSQTEQPHCARLALSVARDLAAGIRPADIPFCIDLALESLKFQVPAAAAEVPLALGP